MCVSYIERERKRESLLLWHMELVCVCVDKNESGEYHQQQQHHNNNEATGNLKNLCKLPWAKRWLKPCKDDEQQEQQEEEKKSLNDDIMYWE